jgi:HlyD family secretion protein
MALERVTRKAAADIAQAQARLKASEAEFQQQKDKLGKIDIQIVKTKIHAPMDGTVIYASSTKMNWRSSDEPLDEGQLVRERQELIYLPTSASYNAEIKVHESSLKKIRVGLPVKITIDALPGKNFTGRITSIAPLPDATSMFMNPDLKVYASVIEIDGNGNELRNGMSCQVEIVVEYFPEALYVPVQAVIQVGGNPTVYVKEGQKFMPRQIKIGLDNNRMIHVVEGVAPGEVVLLTPPLAAGERKPETAPPPEMLESGAAVKTEAQQNSPGQQPTKPPADNRQPRGRRP